MTRHYTWKPDLPDQRDHLFATLNAPAPLPDHVDLRASCPPVVDQGQLGSCTANALAGAMGYLHAGAAAFSRLFIYYNERAIEGTIRSDAGAMIRDGIKTLAAAGVCPETAWPYVIAKFKNKPVAAAFKAALPSKITGYQRLNTLDDMLQCLAAGRPFVFGFTVYTAFESAAVAKSGVLNMPGAGEKSLGGHAVMAVGYDMPSKRFIVRNSWGIDWSPAMGGHFTIPFDYLTNRNLSDDFWTISK